MPRRLRRPATLVAPLLLVSALTAGCGSSEAEGPVATADRLDAVEVSGDFGAAPEVTWSSAMSADAPETEVLTEGDGAELADGDRVLVNYWLGNGYTERTVVDSFGEDAAGFVLTVGEDPGEPQTAADLLTSFVSTQVEAGTTRGSRLVVTANSSEVYGGSVFAPEVMSQDVGNDDGMLLVVDVLPDEVLDAPEGSMRTRDAWAPKIVTGKDRLPTGFDFTGVPAPNEQLRVDTLILGDGEEVAKGDILVADYLGAVAGTDEPFDESFTKEPIETAIGLGAVVKGWDQGLVGVPVGSRVILQIPPKLGYGKAGQGETIPPDSTLYFVIDILAAA